ncbi:MAG: hypothetical protein KJZ91_15745 [Myxococcales bacterium]|nr:hypothetical protein [Myxococcales bacterium]
MTSAPGRGLVASVALALAGQAAAAAADGAAPDDGLGRGAEEPPRRREASWRALARGPYHSSRLFATPVADTVGPYVLAVSWDGSLLKEPGVLSSAGVVAIGFGDLAQLEYRHTAAISLDELQAPVPAVGVQLEAPLPAGPGWPGVALAFRLGVPRERGVGATTVEETVTDLYLVGRQRLPSRLGAVTLHGGVRVSAAVLRLGGDASGTARRRLWLPAGGVEVAAGDRAVVIAEIGLAPSFDRDPAGAPTVDAGVIGRVGARWYLHPAFSFDASVGYQVDQATSAAGARAVVDWDIRLGGELFVPWGAIACKTAGLFCSP